MLDVLPVDSGSFRAPLPMLPRVVRQPHGRTRAYQWSDSLTLARSSGAGSHLI